MELDQFEWRKRRNLELTDLTSHKYRCLFVVAREHTLEAQSESRKGQINKKKQTNNQVSLN